MLKMQCGATAEARAASAVMMILPSPDRKVTIQGALGHLELMKASEGNRMSPISVQAGLNYVLKVLQSLAMGISLETKSDEVSKMSRDCVWHFSAISCAGQESQSPARRHRM